MSLYLWDGKLLVVDGMLAAHERCCCGGPAGQYICVERGPIPLDPEVEPAEDSVWLLREWRADGVPTGDPMEPCTGEIQGEPWLDWSECEEWQFIGNPEHYNGVWFCDPPAEDPEDPCDCVMADKVGPFASSAQCSAYQSEPVFYCQVRDDEDVDDFWDEDGWRYTVRGIHDSEQACEAECGEEGEWV